MPEQGDVSVIMVPTLPKASPANPVVATCMNVLLLAGIALLSNCAPPQGSQQISLPPGAAWHEVAKVGGRSTVTFSYLLNGRKYDMVKLANSTNPVVLENSRLYAVLQPEAMADWERHLATWLQQGELPFEQGLSSLHSWVVAQRRLAPPPPDPSTGSTTIGDAATAVSAAVILAPIAPILLAGGVVGVSEYAMTGKDRRRAQAVNDALLASGTSYRAFLSQLPEPDLETVKGSYEIREYLATKGSFFTWADYFYDVGLRQGKVIWVAYQADPVRQRTYQYWSSQRPSPKRR